MKKLLFILLALCSTEASFAVKRKKILVTTTKNDGPGSLRTALLKANTYKKPSRIIFKLSTHDKGYHEATGTWVFKPCAELPRISANVLIDGYSQLGSGPNNHSIEQGNNAVIVLELHGGAIDTNGSPGFIFGAEACGASLKGFSVTGLPVGIEISGKDISVLGNYIGIAPDGKTPYPNDIGIMIHERAQCATIGSQKPQDSNIIVSCNIGIDDQGTCTRIQHTTVGLDASGDKAIGNGAIGIRVTDTVGTCIGGDLPDHKVVSSGHLDANIFLDSVDQVTVRNVFGGTNTKGTAACGGGSGITICNSKNREYCCDKKKPRLTIQDCLFSGNDQSGVIVGCKSDELRVCNTHIITTYCGTDVTGELSLPNGRHGLVIDFAKETWLINSKFNYNQEHGVHARFSLCAHFDGCDISFNLNDGINMCPDVASAFETLSVVLGTTTTLCTCDGYTGCVCTTINNKGNKVCC